MKFVSNYHIYEVKRDPEDGSKMFLRNVIKILKEDIASVPTRLEFSYPLTSNFMELSPS
jgi:hypothetical protein